MYSVELREENLYLFWNGDPILEGIRPVLRSDDGEIAVAPRTMSVDEAEDGCTRYRVEYGDIENTVTLTLELHCYASWLAVGVRLISHRGENIGERPVCLAAENGLVLHVAGVGRVTGLLANYLYSPWWTAPHFGADIRALPPHTQSLLWSDGVAYHHLLPVCGDIFRAALYGDVQGLQIALSACDGGYTNCEAVACVLASGSDPFALPRQTVLGGLAALGKPPCIREQRPYPELFDYLGWCSWDAFYHDISADKLLDKAREFNRLGLPVRWFIFDDGWLDEVAPRYLRSFDAHPDKFPRGLSPVIRQLKTEHGLRWVGVWHTINGYWNGIHPASPLAQKMRDALYKTNSGKLVPSPEAERGLRFWDAWHGRLAQQGVDFVKVDHQGCLALLYRNELAIGRAAAGTHAALETSVARHFGNRMINCMGMPGENLWHRPISPLARNSDDFYPKREDGFIQHTLQNAYNAYYHGAMMWLDFDMWWTRHPDATRHALLRAVSGGPIYVSDPIGATDPAVLWPLILSNGRILRCEQPGLPTEDCLLRNPAEEPIPLKIWNRCQGAGVVAAFNIHQHKKPVAGTVGPRDVPGLPGERFVIYEHFSRRARVVNGDERLPLALSAGGHALYVIAPVAGPHTPLGLVDKYISPAAIAAQHNGARSTLVMLREGGRFAWVSEHAPTTVRVNGEPVAPTAGDGFYAVDCTGSTGPVWIEIEC